MTLETNILNSIGKTPLTELCHIVPEGSMLNCMPLSYAVRKRSLYCYGRACGASQVHDR